jgi:hypothetical protein
VVRGKFGDEQGGVYGADAGHEVVARLCLIAVYRDGLAAFGEAKRGVALGDLYDPSAFSASRR